MAKNLIDEFKISASKLKRIKGVVFKKQDSKALSLEFTNLAHKFNDCSLSEYAGLLFLGVAKCSESENDIEPLLKGARMFRKANDRKDKLGFINNGEDLEGAFRCYSQALTNEKDPVMKACIIREFSEINKNLSVTSDFHSPCHRVFELELASNEDIKSNNFIAALDKLTEVIEMLAERKCELLYVEVIARIEITRLFLLLLLDLPASRQSPSQIKLIERFSWNHETFETNNFLDENLTLLLEVLVHSCRTPKLSFEVIRETCDELSNLNSITVEQSKILEKIVIKFNRI